MVLRAVRYTRLWWPLILATALLVLAACGGDGGDGGNGAMSNGDGTLIPAARTFLAARPSTTPEPDGGTPNGADPQPAIDAVIDEVLRRLIEVSEEDIEVVSATAQQFPDSCLGIVYADEEVVCEQVITPGFEVVVHFGDTTMTWRASEDGSVVRFYDQEIATN